MLGALAGARAARTPVRVPQNYLDFRRNQRDARAARADPPRGGPPQRANNIKLGPGGIREIEFIAQVFQLIRGARHRAAGAAPLKVLALLPERGIPQAVAELSSAHVFLRRLEHRLQYPRRRPDPDLPEKDEDRALVAEDMGFTDYAALLEVLDAHREVVSQHFDSVFGDPPRRTTARRHLGQRARDTEAATNALGELGYRRPRANAERSPRCTPARAYRQLNNIKSRFDALMPRVLEAAATTPGGGRHTRAHARPPRRDRLPRRLSRPVAAMPAGAAPRRRPDECASRPGRNSSPATRSCSTKCWTRNLDNAPDWKTFAPV